MLSKRVSFQTILAGFCSVSVLFLMALCSGLDSVFAGEANVPEAKAPVDVEVKQAMAKEAAGPRDTDFNSEGFKIVKVVRMERNLNALGIAAQFGKTNKVGKYVELPKRLESSERGEHFLIRWKCSGKRSVQKTVLEFCYKTTNEDGVQTVTKEYADLKKGKRRFLFENTGNDYRARGRIEYWQVSMLADDELVARKQSFLWPIFQKKTPNP